MKFSRSYNLHSVRYYYFQHILYGGHPYTLIIIFDQFQFHDFKKEASKPNRTLRELEKGIIYKSEEKYQQLYTVY